MLIVNTFLKEAGQKGFGLFSSEKIKEGQIIWVDDPVFRKILSNDEVASLPEIAKKFVNKYATPDNGIYYLDLDNTRYLNHSETPNMMFSDTEGIALRDIEIGDEITCDYNTFGDKNRDLGFTNLETISFTKVSLPYGWLGNMSYHNIEYDGKLWHTAESLFQALRFTDDVIREEIRSFKNPMQAKKHAKSKVHLMTVKPLSDEDVYNMKMVLKLKIEKHPELKKELLSISGTIIEDCTKRGRSGSNIFWGSVFEDGKWIGKNVLGNLWMSLRDELK